MTSKSALSRQQFKQVGIWIRVSTEDQAKGDSPEHHERRAQHYAVAKGWKVVEVYHLEAVSGKAIIDHSEAKRMLQHIKTGRISGLIFSKLARLARNTKELLEIADIFQSYGADLISLQESIDTSTPAGRFFYTMFAAMATWEREEIADRVAASVPIRAKLGKPLGGAAPFGYMWKDRKLVPNKEEAPVRKLMHELFALHKRKKTVARLLNEAGYRTRGGAKFSDTTVDRLLRDPTAKGVRRANYTKSNGAGKGWSTKPQDEWVISEVEPIISEELWGACNQILGASRANGKRPTKKTIRLFAGYAFCACGNKMYVPSNTPKYVCFKCKNKIPVDDLEGVFQEQLKSFFISSNDIMKCLEEVDETMKQKQEMLASLTREQAKVRREMDVVFRLYAKDKISADGFANRNDPLEKRLNQIEDQIPSLQGELDYLKIQYLSRDQILTEARDIYSRWPELERDEKRSIIEHTLDRVVIGKDDISIELSYIPPSKFMANGQHMVKGSWPPPA
jgi:site-specific DNA recombinase